MKIKTTNEIIEKSARYIKDGILVLNDNDKKWVAVDDLLKELRTIYVGALRSRPQYTLAFIDRLIKSLSKGDVKEEKK